MEELVKYIISHHDYEDMVAISSICKILRQVFISISANQMLWRIKVPSSRNDLLKNFNINWDT
jgi:hypothetical protein